MESTADGPGDPVGSASDGFRAEAGRGGPATGFAFHHPVA